MNPQFDISIVIPAKDEQQRLPAFLSSIIDHCLKSTKRYEIIVVDDGSQDQTTAVAEAFKEKFSDLFVIRLPFNRGKGHAVKRGIFEARGTVVAFLDADGSTPIDEVERNLHFLNEGYDIVIGSRVVEEQDRKVKALSYRKWMGMIFNWFVHVFLIKDIKDTQCGFKMFRRPVIRPLWGRVYLDGFGFDLEVLYLAQRMGFRIKEVAVNWTHVDGSKIRLLQDSLRMLNNIFQIKFWHYLPINTAIPHMSVKELANMYAQEKDHWWFKAKGNFVRTLVEAHCSNPTTILDAGCGTGHNMKFLQSNATYIGCDVVKEALEFCKHNGISNLVQCHLEEMGFKTQSFDLILSLDVIEHVEDPHTVLQQMKLLLKDNGRLIITVPAFRFLWSPHDESLSHMRRYSKTDLIKAIQTAGLKVETSGYLFAGVFLPVAAIRLLRRLIPTKEHQSDTYNAPSSLTNSLLTKLLNTEAQLLSKFPMPFGTSLYAVVKK